MYRVGLSSEYVFRIVKIEIGYFYVFRVEIVVGYLLVYLLGSILTIV